MNRAFFTEIIQTFYAPLQRKGAISQEQYDDTFKLFPLFKNK